MPRSLTDQDLALFKAKNFGHVSTLAEDGSPHAVVVWIDADDGQVSLNSADHAVKVRHLRRDPRIAVSVHSQDDPYIAVTVIGRAILTTDDAEEHLDRLTRKYTEMQTYPNEWRAPGERRVKITVEIDSVLRYGYQ
jgi:PPOX class probable F420-dependent enzyme